MDGPIALAHGPEGAGNATRMLAVAEELRERDVDLEIAGGGPAARFVELNGFEEYRPANLDFIDRQQDPESSLVDAVTHTSTRVLRRVAGFRRWLADVDPALLLTDDPLAAIPAMLRGIPWFRIDHSSVSCYSAPFARNAFRLWNGLTLRRSEGFFFTTVFENAYPTKANLLPVGPVAHEPADPERVEPVEPFDVLLAMSTYASGADELRERLADEGYDVRQVGGPDWETVPVMMPYHQAADVVVTGGFSSTSEALVAGTPVLNYPFIDCQRGLARQIEARGVEGIDIVRSHEEVLAGVRDPPADPEFENGAPAVAEALVSRLGGSGSQAR